MRRLLLGLDRKLRHALVEMAQCDLPAALKQARLEVQQHNEEKLSRRKEA